MGTDAMENRKTEKKNYSIKGLAEICYQELVIWFIIE